MTELRDLLGRTADIAADFLESLDERPIWPPATLAQLRGALGGPLPEEPVPPERVVTDLAEAADRGIVAEPGGRYFSFVIGGAVPAALSASSSGRSAITRSTEVCACSGSGRGRSRSCPPIRRAG